MSDKKIRLLDGDDPIVEGDLNEITLARIREARVKRRFDYPRWVIME